MEDIERIMNAKNRVFQGGLGLGKDNPISMHTDSSHVYRVTGTSQIEDIINCGYVRPPIGKAKGGHTGEVFWTKGNEKLFFYDKRPVIETSTDILKEEGQIGAISLDKLTGVWMFDEQQNKYVNNIQAVRNAYNQIHPEQEPKPQQPLPDNFWDEFDNPNNGRNAGPERKYNDDGTYTIEYITHLATTPSGFNKDIYDQLMQENETKRQQVEEQMTSGGRLM